MRMIGTAIAIMCLASCSSTMQAPMTSAQMAAQRGGAETLEDGLTVQRFPGGSGSAQVAGASGIDKWTFDCPVDAMTDRRACVVYNLEASIHVSYKRGSTPRTVCVISHDFPGRTAQIRIDANSPVTTNREGCVESPALIAQLKSGSKVTTRYYSWPYDYPKDSTGTLAGFDKAIQLASETLTK